MKLLDKIKSTFFEEEYVEVEEKEHKEVKKVEPVIKDIEDIKEEVYETNDPLKEENVEDIKKRTKLSYFDESDFLDDAVKEDIKEEEEIVDEKKIYGEDPVSLYASLKMDGVYTKDSSYNETKPRFQPTPIISPIYGILDKNYKKEEVIDRKDKPSSYVSRKNADLDSIRKKAYGDVSIFDNNQKEERENEIKDEPMVYDMIEENDTPIAPKVTISDAEEYYKDLGLEYNVDYKDGPYEKASGRRSKNTEVKINNNNIPDEDIDNTKDNLFDIVDSIYNEEGDE